MDPRHNKTLGKNPEGKVVGEVFDVSEDSFHQGVAEAEREGLSKAEPPPVVNQHRPVWDLVIEDMKIRDNEGFKKYGTRLQPNNGRNALIDAYQEVLDLAVYLRQKIEEEKQQAPYEEALDALRQVVHFLIKACPDADSAWMVALREADAAVRKAAR